MDPAEAEEGCALPEIVAGGLANEQHDAGGWVEQLRDLVLDPTRDYQPLGRPPGPPKGSPQRGGHKKNTQPA